MPGDECAYGIQQRITPKHATKISKKFSSADARSHYLERDHGHARGVSIKYVYQNYYNDRRTILAAVFVHEICHSEFHGPSSPPAKHFETDAAAIKFLGGSPDAAADYYRSLYVVKNYWFARKGLAGHSLNAGWNVVNAASLAYGGPACFADFYATDLEQRMKMIVKQYHLTSRRSFPRSSGKEKKAAHGNR